jgi:hypothetical protein
MQRSVIHGLSAAGRSLGYLVSFWVVMTIASGWVYSAPLGPPGEPGNGAPIEDECPECGEVATRKPEGHYLCEKNHISWMWVMWSYVLRSEKPPAPVSSANSVQEVGQTTGVESKETEVG